MNKPFLAMFTPLVLTGAALSQAEFARLLELASQLWIP